MMNMNSFLAERKRISALFDGGKGEEAWKAADELKAQFDSKYDYNIAYAMAQSMENGNSRPDLDVPLYESTAADLDRVLGNLEVECFTATTISCDLIIGLEGRGWKMNGVTYIKGYDGKENRQALVFERKYA